MKSYILAYLEDIKEEYLTEGAKKKLEDDMQEKAEHPYRSKYGDPIQIFTVVSVSILIIAFVFAVVKFGT